MKSGVTQRGWQFWAELFGCICMHCLSSQSAISTLPDGWVHLSPETTCRVMLLSWTTNQDREKDHREGETKKEGEQQRKKLSKIGREMET